VNDQPLDELYLVWLYSQVADPDIVDPSLTYWKLLKQLYTTEFVWHLPHDENRVEDGKDLRREFISLKGLDDVDPEWITLECSMLELMVGLSRRLAFVADGEPYYWFWHLAENIGIQDYSDRFRRFPRRRIDDILQTIVDRTYNYDGSGGFFPLKHPRQDQRNVELWYQLGAYVMEPNE
jgi:hypothetical protein